MQCPGLAIHKYYEDEDLVRCHTLNPDLIEFIAEQGWDSLEKIGEGSVSDVFTCRKNQLVAVIVLFGNVESSEENRTRNVSQKLDKVRGLSGIFPIIYDVLYSDLPYSRDPMYLNRSWDFIDRPIQVIEKVDMTLDKYLPRLTENEVRLFIPILRSTLVDYLEILQLGLIYYTDLKLENIGVIITDKICIKLLDIEGVHLEYDHHFNPKEIVNALIKYEIEDQQPT